MAAISMVSWYVEAPLSWVMPSSPPTGPAAGPGGQMMGAYLVLQPGPAVKDLKGDVTVTADGPPQARSIVEVNRPLHYGGYHFYLHSVDSPGGAYAVLAVRADTGLWAVLAGFALLAAGVFWRLWFRPAWARLARRGADGSGF